MQHKLLIVGAGGHARSILDIAIEMQDYEIVGCLDAQYPNVKSVLGFPEVHIIGDDDHMEKFFKQGIDHIFIALGNNKVREQLYTKALEIGFKPINIISNHAHVSKRATLGKGICVMHGAVIHVNSVIGDNCIINTNSSIDHDCSLGKSVHIAPGVAISGGVKIGNGVQIGTGASVIQNIKIDDWSFIGASSAVVKDVEPNWLYYGVPAKKIKQI